MKKVGSIISVYILFLFLSCSDTYNQGKQLYELKCESCHLNKGQGLGELIPPVANSDFVRNYQDKLACIIKYGINEPIVVNHKIYHEPMLGFPKLTNTEIANIINYINSSLNDIPVYHSPKDVGETLNNCSND